MRAGRGRKGRCRLRKWNHESTRPRPRKLELELEPGGRQKTGSCFVLIPKPRFSTGQRVAEPLPDHRRLIRNQVGAGTRGAQLEQRSGLARFVGEPPTLLRRGHGSARRKKEREHTPWGPVRHKIRSQTKGISKSIERGRGNSSGDTREVVQIRGRGCCWGCPRRGMEARARAQAQRKGPRSVVTRHS